MNRAPPMRIAAACVGAIVFVLCGFYIARNFEWREALALLSGANIAWFVLGGSAAIIGFWLLRAFRWHFLMRGMNVKAGLVDLYLCSSVALSLSVFTPLQTGEAFKVELLKRYGNLPRLPAYGAFMLERVADLYVVVAVGAIALAAHSASLVLALVLAAVFVALPAAGYLVLHKLRFSGRIGELAAHLRSGVGTPAMLLLLLLSTFLSWSMVALGWQFCLLSLSIGLGPAELLGLVSAVTLASIVSFIPGGLGVAETGTTEILIRYGISAPLAQAGALILRAFSLLVIALGTIHFLLLRARRKYPS